MRSLGAIKLVCFGVCSGARSVSRWIVYLRSLPVCPRIEGMDGVEQECGCCCKKDVAFGTFISMTGLGMKTGVYKKEGLPVIRIHSD